MNLNVNTSHSASQKPIGRLTRKYSKGEFQHYVLDVFLAAAFKDTKISFMWKRAGPSLMIKIATGYGHFNKEMRSKKQNTYDEHNTTF